MNVMFLVQFLVLMFVVVVPLIFLMRKLFYKDIENAKSQLDEQAEAARQKQAELNRKLKEADDELARRRAESDALAKKMVSDAEEKVKEEREKIIQRARQEGEEIITKAQLTRDKIRKEIEVEMELKAINYSVSILNKICGDKAKGALNEQLVKEFLEGLEKVDMSQLNVDVSSVDLISIAPVAQDVKDRIRQIVKTKVKRDILVNNKIDTEIMGGVVLKLGTLGLDGSLRYLIKEEGAKYKQKVEGS